MKQLRRFLKRLTSWARTGQDEDRLRAEIEAHIALQTEDNLRAGMSAGEARRQAMLKFGAVEAIKESYRDQRGLPFLEALLYDTRYALRRLRKSPAFTATVVLTLALGIGATTAIFSVVDALLLQPLPYPHSARLANIWLHSPGIGIFRDWPSPGEYLDLKNESHSFDEMAIAQLRGMTLTGRDQPEPVGVIKVSSTLLHMLGSRPILGRLLLPGEDKPGKPPVAILTYPFWRRMFSSNPRIMGKAITLNGQRYTVAGVLSPKFYLNSEVMPAEGPMDKIDVVLPLPLGAGAEQNRRDENYNIMVRLKQGVSLSEAQTDVDVIAARIRKKDRRDRTFGMSVVRLQDQVVGNVRRALLVVLGSVIVVLLIACTNIANLLLTRAASREREIAIRTALGASGWRIVRQLLTESVLLGVAGGAAGLVIAKWALSVVRSINPGNIPRLDDIRINGAVLAFTFGISLVTGILFGLAPAWRALVIDLNASLKSGGRTGQSYGGPGFARNRLRGLLVVSELALSLMLLVGAGLLIRSFTRLQNVPPGFSTKHILSMQVAATGPSYRQDKAVSQFYQEVNDRVAHLPGVDAEGLVSALPLSGEVGWGGIHVEGYTPPPGHELQVDRRVASVNYFRTMGIPLVQGRFFSEHDRGDSQQVAIIDAKFARRFWPHESPIGRHVWFDPKKPITITGVVGVVKEYGLGAEGKIAIYFPQQQAADNYMFLVARTSSDSAALAGAITREIHAVDPNVVVYDIRTMRSLLHHSLARQRFATAMLGAFAAFAMLLAALGVYGVMSYLVSQGTHDIGVRIALGARPANILSLVVRQGMGLILAGILGGLIGALALTRVMAGLLFGVGATDAVSFSAAAVILALVAVVAILIPARRAIKVDPIVALRDE
ncbi:MAG TPA: ABC transporter permease [Terriglobia bacterium]|nr:ABC transporter permease [Terriglobia bacterium]